MNATTEEIRAIKPGGIEPFLCDGGKGMDSVAVLVTRIKRYGFPEGVVDYEAKKFYGKNIILVHAMREGDPKVFIR